MVSGFGWCICITFEEDTQDIPSTAESILIIMFPKIITISLGGWFHASHPLKSTLVGLPSQEVSGGFLFAFMFCDSTECHAPLLRRWPSINNYKYLQPTHALLCLVKHYHPTVPICSPQPWASLALPLQSQFSKWNHALLAVSWFHSQRSYWQRTTALSSKLVQVSPWCGKPLHPERRWGKQNFPPLPC